MVDWPASRGTPSTSWGFRRGTGRVYRGRAPVPAPAVDSTYHGRTMRTRRLGVTAALTVGPIAAWRFAQAYRARAGYPHRHPPEHDPSALGLAFDELSIPSHGVDL